MSSKSIAEQAIIAAGNHTKFNSFALFHGDYADDVDTHWTIRYTSNRDSDIISKSNESEIIKAMTPFIENESAKTISHGHFACGYVDGLCVRVYEEGSNPSDNVITEAFKTLCELEDKLDDYPILNEDDVNDRQLAASLQNIWSIVNIVEFDSEDVNESVEPTSEQVYSWLSANEPEELEDNDDGAYPSEESVKRALIALGRIKE